MLSTPCLAGTYRARRQAKVTAMASPLRGIRPIADATRLVAVPRQLAELADRQHGVLARRQLYSAGFDQHHIRTAVRARRWQVFGRHAVVLHNAALTERQRE